MDDSKTNPEVNELDEALAYAQENPAHGNFFFDAFLNAGLFAPVRVVDRPQGDWRGVGPNERFQPMYLPHGETRVLPVFNQLDRLKTWAGDLRLDYLYLPCHLLLGVVSKEIGMALNPGTQWTYYFSPELLNRLREAMHPVKAT